MREDFAAFVLTFGRPDRVDTVATLEGSGYTGKLFLVCDDEDPTVPAYVERYGAERVLVFSKEEIAARFDEGDNFNDRRAVFYARNACWDLARRVGVRYFVQLDDDYGSFYYRFDGAGRYDHTRIDDLDWLFSRLVDFLAATPFASVAISQGGDHIGGAAAKRVIGTKRKAMNTFVCDVERPFDFVGRINEDVNTYTCEQRRGVPFLTFLSAQVNQLPTQSNAGGMTELYLDSGTYVKSFYSVMYAPSCAKIGELRDPKYGGGHPRLHHVINWDAAAPCIVSAAHRKTRNG